MSEAVSSTHVDSLISDIREIRAILGNVWAQLPLVRAGSAKLRRDGLCQTAEVAMGTRTPFAACEFAVGAQMIGEELYLVRDHAEAPLPLGRLVQLRSAPSSAQFTTYFYNRTDGEKACMVSYQYGPESEVHDNAASLRADFGGLVIE
ncbi:hypothetical protein [Falsarthrobacter nasiphocae]|uniref:Uncharacterized protein n=1 Tax=Falsarthrobacter nasiphocae TaxID=189863 RepID=A0AAE3YFM9_9MICC|nr:hypothetical protein [Falsarthrobacter nasiphocae]MDR6891357.1 hypothetical protein [Falsarthrobacter nasiphocae]